MAETEPIQKNENGTVDIPDGVLRTLASTLISRAALQASLGKTYGNNRDLYKALGYTKEPVFEDYYNRYDRQDIATRIVEAYPAACWRKKPDVTESEDDETEFEKKWKQLVKENKVWHYLRRADILAGIGRFGALMIGFDDVTSREQLIGEVKNAKSITYLKALMEDNIQIKTWEREPTNPRFGLPLTYSITVYSTGEDTSETLEVHHSRMIHLAENPRRGDVYGTPRLHNILNRLQDLELVAGGSGEMFWRGAFPGFNFSIDKDFNAQDPALATLQTEIDEYVHNLRRYIRTQGVTAESLSQQVASPEGHTDLYFKLLSAATGIPLRIITGSERGELASSQDEKNWNDRVDERRLDYCEPFILRPFIDKLIEVGILPEVKDDGYVINWPDLDVPSDKEQADISKTMTDTLVAYSNSQGADMIVTPTMFLKKFMGFDDDELKQMAEALGNAESLDDAYDAAWEEKDKDEEEKFEKRAAISAKHAPKPPGGGKFPAAKGTIKTHHAKHDQKSHGSWAKGVTMKTASDLHRRIAEDGGFTYHPSTHTYPSKGYAVATYRDFEKIFEATTEVSVDELITPNDIKAFYAAHKDTFAKDPNAHIGGWFDTENNKVYLDVSSILTNKREAMKLGRQYKQEAIYDLGAGKEIPIGARDDLKAAAKKKATLVRFDFKPGASPEEVAAGINEIVKKYKK